MRPVRLAGPMLLTGIALLTVGGATLSLTGCQRAKLQFESYRDPYFPETFQIDLRDCVYRVAPGGDYYVAGHSTRAPLPKEHQVAAGSDAASPGGAGNASEHYLMVHVFWKPKPGKTWADSSMTDATLTYTVVTGQGTLTYTGTGFAYPRKVATGFDFDIESARLRLTSRTGAGPDLFGNTRLKGTLHARQDPAAMVNLVREAQIAAAGH